MRKLPRGQFKSHQDKDALGKVTFRLGSFPDSNPCKKQTGKCRVVYCLQLITKTSRKNTIKMDNNLTFLFLLPPERSKTDILIEKKLKKNRVTRKRK